MALMISRCERECDNTLKLNREIIDVNFFFFNTTRKFVHRRPVAQNVKCVFPRVESKSDFSSIFSLFSPPNVDNELKINFVGLDNAESRWRGFHDYRYDWIFIRMIAKRPSIQLQSKVKRKMSKSTFLRAQSSTGRSALENHYGLRQTMNETPRKMLKTH